MRLKLTEFEFEDPPTEPCVYLYKGKKGEVLYEALLLEAYKSL